MAMLSFSLFWIKARLSTPSTMAFYWIACLLVLVSLALLLHGSPRIWTEGGSQSVLVALLQLQPP
ncbi:hypothetical protein DAPPUDRAFT_265477 [Daphnia pulex]|uniref:Uncharacterized protein n=1 Tax=Daphnia pulex TaxID=6669 RepID=E9HTI4_DAPPU|nr:hypothetical protein DAPPUDRAFT_265477 [Daphnia pulex]|eukprot:EFX64948.1 hypothetical protein DAPPUDRAFT_265477 [Daphnia pulex]